MRMDKLFSTSSLWLLVFIVVIAGLFAPHLIGNDAPEYASIALRMHRDHDYVNIINRDYDYLDKPHMLFWSAALGYNLFGVHDWSYRLLSVLVCLLGAYATFRLGKHLYNQKVGTIASLMFISAQAIQIGNHDVRTDALLTGFVILSVWQFVAFIDKEKLINILIGSAALALAVGTKGMIAVLVVGCCIFFYLLSMQKWYALLRWQWLAAITMFFVVLSPVLYCYYVQFDLHPEKLVKGQTGVSGIEFLFWNQGVERLAANQSLKENNPEFLFLFHNFLWSFLPWTFLAIGAWFDRAKDFYRQGVSAFSNKEQLTFLGTFVMFLVMSLSKFKLPHYTNVLFPMIAIGTAAFLQAQQERNSIVWKRYFKFSRDIVVFLLVVAAVVLNTWFMPAPIWMLIIAIICVLLIYASYQQLDKLIQQSNWIPLLVTILCVNLFMSVNYYPQLAKYQAGSAVAEKIKQEGIDWSKVYISDRIFRSFDFYSGRINPQLTLEQIKDKLATQEKFYVLVNEAGKQKLTRANIPFRQYFKTPDMNITRATYKFLNPSTRPTTVKYAYLLEVN
jgi:4-amino-4-deoxy-L-arabinose transferase-like glycosyltransferase